eukprot:CAMPEP_0172750046 /NCGR_PEP_ID=MMETSP1074-20121228/148757_1 /TAXON_ID=2916 /ORGANISM="Ceratium fusus, Strain PA161109" /LENGTH=53 /DNA_ID=CAMNT_0013582119 /DNA_START=229 /DNA_END=387 /DNA_ORIENTATION=-
MKGATDVRGVWEAGGCKKLMPPNSVAGARTNRQIARTPDERRAAMVFCCSKYL